MGGDLFASSHYINISLSLYIYIYIYTYPSPCFCTSVCFELRMSNMESMESMDPMESIYGFHGFHGRFGIDLGLAGKTMFSAVTLYIFCLTASSH